MPQSPNVGTSIIKLTVLDIGRGIGAHSEYLARLVLSVIGCDHSDLAIKSAITWTQPSGLDFKLRVIDPDTIPFLSCDIAIVRASRIQCTNPAHLGS